MSVTVEGGSVTVTPGGRDVVLTPPSTVEVTGGGSAVSVDSPGSATAVSPGPVQVVSAGGTGPQGPPGPQGPDGAGKTSIRFDWGDVSPKYLTTIAAGRTVLSAGVWMFTAFNAAGGTLTIGTLADPDELMTATDPSFRGSSSETPSVEYATDTDIYLTISLGGGTSAGTGYAVIEVNNND